MRWHDIWNLLHSSRGWATDETGLAQSWQPLKLGDWVPGGSFYFVLYFCVRLEFFVLKVFLKYSFSVQSDILSSFVPAPPTMCLQRSQRASAMPRDIKADVLITKMPPSLLWSERHWVRHPLSPSPLPSCPAYTRQLPGASGVDFSQELTGPHEKQTHSLNPFVSLIPGPPHLWWPTIASFTGGPLFLRGRK